MSVPGNVSSGSGNVPIIGGQTAGVERSSLSQHDPKELARVLAEGGALANDPKEASAVADSTTALPGYTGRFFDGVRALFGSKSATQNTGGLSTATAPTTETLSEIDKHGVSPMNNSSERKTSNVTIYEENLRRRSETSEMGIGTREMGEERTSRIDAVKGTLSNMWERFSVTGAMKMVGIALVINPIANIIGGMKQGWAQGQTEFRGPAGEATAFREIVGGFVGMLYGLGRGSANTVGLLVKTLTFSGFGMLDNIGTSKTTWDEAMKMVRQQDSSAVRELSILPMGPKELYDTMTRLKELVTPSENFAARAGRKISGVISGPSDLAKKTFITGMNPEEEKLDKVKQELGELFLHIQKFTGEPIVGAKKEIRDAQKALLVSLWAKITGKPEKEFPNAAEAKGTALTGVMSLGTEDTDEKKKAAREFKNAIDQDVGSFKASLKGINVKTIRENLAPTISAYTEETKSLSQRYEEPELKVPVEQLANDISSAFGLTARAVATPFVGTYMVAEAVTMGVFAGLVLLCDTLGLSEKLEAAGKAVKEGAKFAYKKAGEGAEAAKAGAETIGKYTWAAGAGAIAGLIALNDARYRLMNPGEVNQAEEVIRLKINSNQQELRQTSLLKVLADQGKKIEALLIEDSKEEKTRIAGTGPKITELTEPLIKLDGLRDAVVKVMQNGRVTSGFKAEVQELYHNRVVALQIFAQEALKKNSFQENELDQTAEFLTQAVNDPNCPLSLYERIGIARLRMNLAVVQSIMLPPNFKKTLLDDLALVLKAAEKAVSLERDPSSKKTMQESLLKLNAQRKEFTKSQEDDKLLAEKGVHIYCNILLAFNQEQESPELFFSQECLEDISADLPPVEWKKGRIYGGTWVPVEEDELSMRPSFDAQEFFGDEITLENSPSLTRESLDQHDAKVLSDVIEKNESVAMKKSDSVSSFGTTDSAGTTVSSQDESVQDMIESVDEMSEELLKFMLPNINNKVTGRVNAFINQLTKEDNVFTMDKAVMTEVGKLLDLWSARQNKNRGSEVDYDGDLVRQIDALDKAITKNPLSFAEEESF